MPYVRDVTVNSKVAMRSHGVDFQAVLIGFNVLDCPTPTLFPAHNPNRG